MQVADRFSGALKDTVMGRMFFGGLALVFGATLSLNLLVPLTAVAFAGGDGSEENPYKISTCEQLQNMEEDLEAYYQLTQDIDCSDSESLNDGDGFIPIGMGEDPFMGELDGNHHVITGLTIVHDDWKTGLFGKIGTWEDQVGLVKNLGLVDVDVAGEWSTGAIAGVLYGQINNSYATGEVSGTGEVGGLAGSHGGVWDTVINSWSDVDVSGQQLVGGLVGYNAENSNIINSYALGDVSAAEDRIGGAVGYNQGNVTNVHAAGMVSGGEGSDLVGGLVGQNDSTGAVSKSYATGTVQAGGEIAGGLVGLNQGTIEKSYAHNTPGGEAEVGVATYCLAGGLVGENQNSGSINNSFARSSVFDVECVTGGLAATNDGDIVQTYAATDTTGAAGLVGDNYDAGSIYVSFWDEELSEESTGCTYGDFDCTDDYRAMGRTTSQMKMVGTYTDVAFSEGMWDFETLWYIDPEINDGYPFFIDGAGASLEEWPESVVPAEQDLNGDGIADSEQPNVVSTKSVTNKTVVLEVDDACTVEQALVKAEATHTVQDPGYNYPEGLLNFTVDCGEAGFTTIVKQYYYNVDSTNFMARKYNPNSKAYFAIAGATITKQTVHGQSVVVAAFSIKDGSNLDIDGQVNGVIVDPAGLGVQAVSAPDTGFRRN